MGKSRRVEEKRLMFEAIVIGHKMRGDGLMKEVIEEKMEGKRRQARSIIIIGLIDDLLEKEWYADMKNRV